MDMNIGRVLRLAGDFRGAGISGVTYVRPETAIGG
jgi:hypothetical protein